MGKTVTINRVVVLIVSIVGDNVGDCDLPKPRSFRVGDEVAFVGDNVGVAVKGAFVGRIVGFSVGFLVGFLVGFFVGDSVGELVGLLVGPRVG